tara:strand:+ start:479 stop:733 length:255 start_codon:yes stop_codon:yes gene_type:complete
MLVADAKDKWKQTRAAQVEHYASLPKMKNIYWIPKRDRWMVRYKGKQDFTSLTPEGAQDVLRTLKIRHIRKQIKQLELELGALI